MIRDMALGPGRSSAGSMQVIAAYRKRMSGKAVSVPLHRTTLHYIASHCTASHRHGTRQRQPRTPVAALFLARTIGTAPWSQ